MPNPAQQLIDFRHQPEGAKHFLSGSRPKASPARRLLGEDAFHSVGDSFFQFSDLGGFFQRASFQLKGYCLSQYL